MLLPSARAEITQSQSYEPRTLVHLIPGFGLRVARQARYHVGRPRSQHQRVTTSAWGARDIWINLASPARSRRARAALIQRRIAAFLRTWRLGVPMARDAD